MEINFIFGGKKIRVWNWNVSALKFLLIKLQISDIDANDNDDSFAIVAAAGGDDYMLVLKADSQ